RSLHIGYFSVQKRNLNILVDVNLLGPETYDLVRRADCRFHLIGRLSFFYLLRLCRRLLLLFLSLSLPSASTLIVPLIVAALLVALPLLVVGANGKQLGDRIFHLARARFRQSTAREL